MDYTLSPAARQDVLEIFTYVAERSGSATVADRLIQGLIETVVMITNNPLAGRRRDELKIGLRSFAKGQYVIFYRVTSSRVSVSRIVRGSRELKLLLS